MLAPRCERIRGDGFACAGLIDRASANDKEPPTYPVEISDMTPQLLALSIAAAVTACGLLGLLLQRRLHESFTTGSSRDMIGAVAGLLTLLSALVMGLLIWTAYGVYSGQNLAIQSLAGKVLQLDLALADYGPDAKPLREKLKDSVASTIDEIWGARQSDAHFVSENLSAAVANVRSRSAAVKTLHPQTDEQKQALALATTTADSISQARVAMALALANPISFPLLFTVAGWACLLFLAYGLTSKAHTMTILSVLIGAIAIGSAFFLILDLSVPYYGLFHVSPAPLEDVMKVIGRDAG